LEHLIAGTTTSWAASLIHPAIAAIIDPAGNISVKTCSLAGARDRTTARYGLIVDRYGVDRARMDTTVIHIRECIAIIMTGASYTAVACRTSAVNTATDLIFTRCRTTGCVPAGVSGTILTAIKSGFSRGADSIRANGAISTRSFSFAARGGP